MDKPTHKIEFIVSTKAELITEKVNKWLENNKDYSIWAIIPFMSYTSIKDKGALMIGCMIEYEIPNIDIEYTFSQGYVEEPKVEIYNPDKRIEVN